MQKFRLLHEYLKSAGIATTTNTFRPGRAKKSLLALAHCPQYLDRFCENQLDAKAIRRMGLPWSEPLLKRSLISPAGTLLAAHLAMRYGIACHLAGGTHHAHFDFGSGFCVLNDLAVTAKALLTSAHINRVLIFDCDVHQGDGTASILAHTPQAFTCSVHCDKNFPARKARSDLDIEVPKGAGDQGYLDIIESALDLAFQQSQPDIVLYDAGVDIYAGDPLGLLNVSLKGMAQRDRLVLEYCKQRAVPVVTVIGGGYDKDDSAVARRHAITVETAADLFKP